MLELNIGGRNYTANAAGADNQPGVIDILSMKISDVISPTGDTLTARGHIQDIVSNLPAVPLTEEPVSVWFTNPNGGERYQIFGGQVQVVNSSIYAADAMSFDIQCRDFLKQLNGILVSGVFTELTISEMVRSVLRQFAPTFPVRIFADGTEKILPKVFNFRTCGDVLQELADASFGGWQLTPGREVLFVTQRQIDNPVVSDLGVGQTPFRERTPTNMLVPEDEVNAVRGFRWTKSTEDITNSLVVQDFHFRDPDLTFVPGEFDPEETQDDFIGAPLDVSGRGRFILQSVPHDLHEFTFQYRRSSSELWQDVPVRWDISPTTPIDDLRAGVVWAAPGNKGATCAIRWRLGSFAGAPAPQFRFSYRTNLVSVFAEISQDANSIAEFQQREGSWSNGTYEKLISLEDLEFIGENPIDNLTEYGRSILSLFAWPVITGSFKTDSMQFENHWRAGQHFDLISPTYGIYDLRRAKLNGDIGDSIYYDSSNNLKVYNALTVWITRVSIDIKSSDLLEYKIDFSNVRPGFHGI